MTNGEWRVGVNFNPSGNDNVDNIKRAAADLIDMIDTIPPVPVRGLAHQSDETKQWEGEVLRLKALAKTAIEEGAMWAVKAATKQKRQ